MNDDAKPAAGIAIVGMAGRFPGADDLEAFWRNLRSGVESITFFSREELKERGVPEHLLAARNYVPAAACVRDSDCFDAAFFGMSPVDALLLDPQHRLFLETCWAALEHAGCDPDRSEGRIGVYGGMGASTHGAQLRHVPGLLEAAGAVSLRLATGADFLTTRVSYKLNLRGPSLDVQTACSTSLVAVILACQALQCFQCDAALAGGVSLNQELGYLYEPEGIFSPDGHCRAFDASAGGMVNGAGVGVVVLKRLEDALADGDTIHAVIKGYAMNNDGSERVGFTAPSVQGQRDVVVEALADAEVEAGTIRYVEAHGTATALGDPIEIAALTQAFRASTQDRGFCAIGSVKTNIGHALTAAGIAGLLKTVLALRHRQLPPSLHFREPNPGIDFASSPFFVNAELADWKADGAPRRAGVSSFGMGGTNAHVIVEEAPPSPPDGAARDWQLLTVSARTPTALERSAANLSSFLRANPTLSLADAAYTLHLGRKAFRHRRVAVGRTSEELVSSLEADHPASSATVEPADEPRVVFMFPGQGAQHLHMAAGLYATEPVFRSHVDACARVLEAACELRLLEVLYPQTADPETGTRRLTRTAMAQPALFVVEYALARLFMDWGVHPEALIGHSLGELVAACLAGVFSLEDALRLVALRGRLMEAMPEGAMLAVPLPEDELRATLDEHASVAAVNGPRLCVVSGPSQVLSAWSETMRSRGIECQPLQTSHAFHSASMDPIIDAFTTAVRQTERRAPTIPFISNVSGTWITDEEATSETYWARHLRHTVRFADGVGALAKDGARVFLEVGPGRTLGQLVRQCLGPDRVAVSSMRHPQEGAADPARSLEALGKLWLAGAPIDWARFHAHERRRRIPLPTYPFERRRHALASIPGSAPEPQGSAGIASVAARQPTTSPALEQAVCQLWRELLGVEAVAAADNFLDLGGHSLLATQVVARIRDQWDVDISIRDFFQDPTVAGLAARIAAAQEPGRGATARVARHLPPLVSTSRTTRLELSFAQQRIWFLATLEPEDLMHNMQASRRLVGALDVRALKQALGEIVRRHEALRTTFRAHEGKPFQVIAPPSPFPLRVLDLSGRIPAAARDAELRRRARDERGQPFDLEQGPLIRGTLLRFGPEEHALFITVHHIVFDAWCWAVLFDELKALYPAFAAGAPSPLREPPIQYADFAAWERSLLSEEVVGAELAHWKRVLAGVEPVEIPTDRPRPALRTYDGASVPISIPAALAGALRDLARGENGTLFMVLLAAFDVLLHRCSGRDVIAVGTPVANRRHVELEGLIGLFANALTLVTDLSGAPTFRELLRRVRTTCLTAQDHQELPFEKIVAELAPRRETDRDPLFRILFALDQFDEASIELPGLTLRPIAEALEQVRFDVSLRLTERAGLLEGKLSYRADLFDPSTIVELARRFEALLRRLIERPDDPISLLASGLGE